MSEPSGTEEATRRHSVWPLWAWSMIGVLVATVVAGVLTDILVPSVVLDLLSFWPGLLLALLTAGALMPVSRRGPARFRAILPLLVLTWLGSGLALHLMGWEQLPSSAADVAGPVVDEITDASLTIDLDGRLEVAGALDDALYRVEIGRHGGAVGVPESLETETDPGRTIRVRMVDGGLWYRSSAWHVAIRSDVAWTLDLDSPELDVDVTGVRIDGGSFSGSGGVTLPEVDEATEVALSGNLTVVVPAGTAVELVVEDPDRTDVSLPPPWVDAPTGWRSLGEGEGYRLVAAPGMTLVITEA